jgi:hypothetical protein
MSVKTYNYTEAIHFEVGKGSYLLNIVSSVWNNIYDENSILQFDGSKISIIKDDICVVTINLTLDDIKILLLVIDKDGQEKKKRNKEASILRDTIEIITKSRMERVDFNSAEKMFIADRVDEELKDVDIMDISNWDLIILTSIIYRNIVKEVIDKFPIEDKETILLYDTFIKFMEDIVSDHIMNALTCILVASLMKDKVISLDYVNELETEMTGASILLSTEYKYVDSDTFIEDIIASISNPIDAIMMREIKELDLAPLDILTLSFMTGTRLFEDTDMENIGCPS